MHINGHEVPAPLAADPDFHQWYWYPSLTKPLAQQEKWFETATDRERMQHGLVHTTEQAAQAHAVALLSFTANVSDAALAAPRPFNWAPLVVFLAIAALAVGAWFMRGI